MEEIGGRGARVVWTVACDSGGTVAVLDDGLALAVVAASMTQS
jgi:hypothetical protein